MEGKGCTSGRQEGSSTRHNKVNMLRFRGTALTFAASLAWITYPNHKPTNQHDHHHCWNNKINGVSEFIVLNCGNSHSIITQIN